MTCKIAKKCDHESLVYCSCCNRVKCKDCDAIWNRQFLSTYSPFYSPYIYQGNSSTAGSFSNNFVASTCQIGS